MGNILAYAYLCNTEGKIRDSKRILRDDQIVCNKKREIKTVKTSVKNLEEKLKMRLLKR